MDQPHQPRWPRRALADTDHPAVAGLLQCLVVEHLHLETRRFAQSLCTLCEFGGKQVTRGSVDQIAGGGHRGRDGRTVRALFLGVFAARQHRNLAQPIVFRRRLAAAEGVEPVAAQDQPLHRGRADVVAGFTGQLCQRGDRRLGTAERAGGHAGGATDGVRRPLRPRFAQADRQHAAHRQRRHHEPVHLLTAAGGGQRPQAGLDFGDRISGQERLGGGDNDRARPLLRRHRSRRPARSIPKNPRRASATSAATWRR